MARKLRIDRWLFAATLGLVCASVVMVYSASAVMALERFQQPYLFLFKQAAWAALGLLFLGGLMNVDYRRYKHPTVIRTAVMAVGIALVAVLFGPEINGTRRWFGVAGIGVQPSELAKVAAILFTAAMIDTRMERINDLRHGLGPIALTVGALAALILLEPDFGTALTLLLITGVMVFAAGLSWRYVTGAGVLVVVVVCAAVASSGYRTRRWLTFLDPWRDPLGDGFQIIQSLIAVGTGGITGGGLMAGKQRLFFLPEPHTDFIYAVISEELGLVGATLVLLAFLVIAWRGLTIAMSVPDRFGAFLALGITTMIALQALVNISVVLGLLPTKGIPLPFVSAGGSSLLINLVAMGILLNVSQHASSQT
jgi:cell division protein FtsW